MQISSDHSLLILNGEIRRKKNRSDLLCVTVGWSDLMFLILNDPIRRNMRLSNKIRRFFFFGPISLVEMCAARSDDFSPQTRSSLLRNSTPSRYSRLCRVLDICNSTVKRSNALFILRDLLHILWQSWRLHLLAQVFLENTLREVLAKPQRICLRGTGS